GSSRRSAPTTFEKKLISSGPVFDETTPLLYGMVSQRALIRFHCLLPALVATLGRAPGVEGGTVVLPSDAAGEEGPAFVVGAGTGSGMTSADGVTWTRLPVAPRTGCRSQCSGRGLLVRVGQEGGLWTSPNGTNWIARNPGTQSALHRV